MEQMLAHGARFKADPFNRMGKRSKTFSDVARLALQLSIHQHPSLAINNAKRTRSQRHVNSGKIFHLLSPLFTVIL
jgi:hypothetical protein